MLAAHVVRRGQPAVQRRAAQRPLAGGGVGDAEGEVGATAGDALEAQRRLGARDVVGEPAFDAGGVDAVGRLLAGR